MSSRITLLRADDTTLSGALPSTVDRSALTRGVASSGTPTFTQSGTSFRGGYRAMTGIGDYVQYEEVLQAGTYALDLETVDASSGGAFIVTIDGTTITTKDTYNASGGATRTETTGIVIAASGRHQVKLTVTTKNASSSATTCRVAGYTLTRTGA